MLVVFIGEMHFDREAQAGMALIKSLAGRTIGHAVKIWQINTNRQLL